MYYVEGFQVVMGDAGAYQLSLQTANDLVKQINKLGSDRNGSS